MRVRSCIHTRLSSIVSSRGTFAGAEVSSSFLSLLPSLRPSFLTSFSSSYSSLRRCSFYPLLSSSPFCSLPPLGAGRGRAFSSVTDLYDVVVVGGGITGTALLYTLSAFTNVRKTALLERREDFAIVASHARNNSQTIHCGDIETNYSLAKAKAVKRQADMLRNYATKIPSDQRDRCIYKMPKMALAVGAEEGALLKERYEEFHTVFKNMQLIDKQQVAEVEPRVAMVNSYQYRPDDLCAIYISNEYSAVNYYNLANVFVQHSQEISKQQVEAYVKTEVNKIEHGPAGTFVLETSRGSMQSRYVVVSACGHSLLLAHRLGYGLEFSCMPVAGSFYFSADEALLNGKVYTLQNPILPFAAVHGDPDILAMGKTRFGPTALPLPLLERHNFGTFKDFLEILKPDLGLLAVYWNLAKVSTIRNYVLRNFLFEIPKLNAELFAEDVRKIIPSMSSGQLMYAQGFGGVRPQLVDKVKQKLLLGEGRIQPETNIVFNITPSPGGTTCLGAAEQDARRICQRLNFTFDEAKFKDTLLMGEYPVNY